MGHSNPENGLGFAEIEFGQQKTLGLTPMRNDRVARRSEQARESNSGEIFRGGQASNWDSI